jgi:hypothetical protein
MMRMSRGWTGLRTAVITLGLLAGSVPCAQADGILKYSTAGGPGTAGITGAGPVISFLPVQNESVDTASNISLGTFQVAGLATGQSTMYNHTPFTLSIIPTSFNGTALNDMPIQLTGFFNGTVSGPYRSDVQVTFNPVSNPTFPIGTKGTGTLSLLPSDQQLLVPSSVNDGRTTLQAQVSTTGIEHQAVPEPSTIALFLSTVGGLGLRRYVQARRQRGQA